MPKEMAKAPTAKGAAASSCGLPTTSLAGVVGPNQKGQVAGGPPGGVVSGGPARTLGVCKRTGLRVEKVSFWHWVWDFPRRDIVFFDTLFPSADGWPLLVSAQAVVLRC